MENTPKKAQSPAKQETTSSATPVAAFRFERVSAAIFTEEVKTKDGKASTAYNISLRRSYRDADGAWAHTHTLRSADLLAASLALVKCFEFVQDAQGAKDEKQA